MLTPASGPEWEWNVTTLEDYGSAIAATTAAVRAVLATADPSVMVTTRHPHSVRQEATGASVNLFLYQDQMIRYRQASRPLQREFVVGAELHYLVSVHPAEEAELGAVSHGTYGTARAAIEMAQEVTVTLPSGATLPAHLSTLSLSLADLTSLWLATGEPLRTSFGFTARIPLPPAITPDTAIGEIVSRARPGLVVAFEGPDAAAKSAAAASVAQKLGKPLLHVALDRLVSKYIGETEKSLRVLFERADTKDAVLYIDEADALFSYRATTIDSGEKYAGVDGSVVLDVLARSSGVVIISVGEPGDAMLAHAEIYTRFPPA